MTTATEEERIQAEIEKAKTMKVSELKMKLMAKGVLTSTFVEKDEFVRAYAEAMTKDPSSSSSSSAGAAAAAPVVEDVVDDEDDDDDVNFTEDLPPYVKRRVDKLREIDEEREALMKEYLAERASLEAKYERLSFPLFEKRATVVAGGLDDEIAAASAENDDDGDDGGETEKDAGIPQFWACAVHQMPVTRGLVELDDLECLASLEDIRCESHIGGTGFTLEFHFGRNDFFSNEVLTKTYEVPNLLLGDEPILQNVEGCAIDWKPGRCLTEGTVTKKMRGTGKNAGQIKTVTKTVPKSSFFRFFEAPAVPDIHTASEEEVEKLELAFAEDYDVAQAFRSHIVPKAVLWFAGDDAMEREMEAALENLDLSNNGGGVGGFGVGES